MNTTYTNEQVCKLNGGLSSISIGPDGDTDTGIFECAKKYKMPMPRLITRHACVSKAIPPPRAKKCDLRNCFCTNRTSKLAVPKLQLMVDTLNCYSSKLEPARVVHMIRLLHEAQNPKRTRFLQHGKRKRKRKCHCDKNQEQKIWYVPTYHQLQVSMMLVKRLKLSNKKKIEKPTKQAICKILQKFAVLFDVKCEPYKRVVKVDSESETTIEDKHVVFNMKEYDFYSEPSSEQVAVTPDTFDFRNMPEEEAEKEPGELFASFFALQGEGVDEDESVSEDESVISEETVYEYEYQGESDEEIPWEYVDKTREVSLGEEDENEVSFSEDEENYESFSEEEISEFIEETSLDEVTVEEEFAEAEKVFEKESEIMGIAGMLDYHPEGTSSYVSWYLYLCWLNEFSKNIAAYFNCLRRFREAATKCGAAKFNDVIMFVLENWSSYLAEVKAVDLEMQQYFKDKPVTRCTRCKDYTCYDMITDHEVPRELLYACQITKKWKKLFERVEKYCQNIVCEEYIEIDDVDSYEILELILSDSSDYSVEEL